MTQPDACDEVFIIDANFSNRVSTSIANVILYYFCITFCITHFDALAFFDVFNLFLVDPARTCYYNVLQISGN